jgi:hypothetical protein
MSTSAAADAIAHRSERHLPEVDTRARGAIFV